MEDAQADESMALWASGFVSRRFFGSLCDLHKRLEGLVGGWMFGWNFRSRQSPAAPAYMLSTSWVEGGKWRAVYWLQQPCRFGLGLPVLAYITGQWT